MNMTTTYEAEGRQRLSQLIHQELDQRQWSAMELMRRSGSTTPTVSRVLRGLRVRSSTLEQIERALGWPAGDAQRILDEPDYVPEHNEPQSCCCQQAMQLVAQAGQLLGQMAEFININHS